MKIHLAPFAARRDQDLAVRLKFAAERRASDEARRKAPDHSRWIAPDAAPLLDAILTNSASFCDVDRVTRHKSPTRG